MKSSVRLVLLLDNGALDLSIGLLTRQQRTFLGRTLPPGRRFCSTLTVVLTQIISRSRSLWHIWTRLNPAPLDPQLTIPTETPPLLLKALRWLTCFLNCTAILRDNWHLRSLPFLSLLNAILNPLGINRFVCIRSANV